MTKVRRQQLEVSDQGEVLRIIDTDQILCFRSKTVVIANGGVQSIHPNLFNWFPQMNPQRVIASDAFLRKDCYLSTMKMINEQNLKKIVIIGGSHSGFSTAWMLLNGPATYKNNNAGIPIDRVPYAPRKSIKNCADCCHCGASQMVETMKKRKP